MTKYLLIVSVFFTLVRFVKAFQVHVSLVCTGINVAQLNVAKTDGEMEVQKRAVLMTSPFLDCVTINTDP
ncbi:hypothetical protein KUL156_05770 [Alteromonas sp. KUL156]|nr:hypothetical protein KUL154_21840 [Alteromonas sp. KUL154]GFD97984.1 hypothetical protein KUL156_05770 [Alteromonas sp. KUL156]